MKPKHGALCTETGPVLEGLVVRYFKACPFSTSRHFRTQVPDIAALEVESGQIMREAQTMHPATPLLTLTEEVGRNRQGGFRG
jgi:hypothetical protein